VNFAEQSRASSTQRKRAKASSHINNLPYLAQLGFSNHNKYLLRRLLLRDLLGLGFRLRLQKQTRFSLSAGSASSIQ
jgi:hypothetical protein